MVGGGVEGDRLDAARLLGQGQLGGGDAAGGQRARRREAPKLDLKMRISFLVIPHYSHHLKGGESVVCEGFCGL